VGPPDQAEIIVYIAKLRVLFFQELPRQGLLVGGAQDIEEIYISKYLLEYITTYCRTSRFCRLPYDINRGLVMHRGVNAKNKSKWWPAFQGPS
jgi:hypothetical protein